MADYNDDDLLAPAKGVVLGVWLSFKYFWLPLILLAAGIIFVIIVYG